MSDNDKREPEMKSMLVVVFGHYDSRGGTMAIPITEATEAAVRAAMKKYDRDGFGIEEPGDEIQTTAYGMAARECDKLVHAMLHPDNSMPSSEDFLYVAQLWYPEGASLEGDLEEPDDDGRWRRVMKSGGADEDRVGLGEDWAGWPYVKKVDKSWTSTFDGTVHPYVDLDEESVLHTSLIHPVQLELVVLPESMGRFAQEKATANIRHAMEAIRERYHGATRPGDTTINGKKNSGYYWDDEGYKRLQEGRDRIDEDYEQRREKAAKAAARILKDATTTRWDDDAYGFVILGS